VRVVTALFPDLSLWVYQPIIKLLRKGDVVWIHNRPAHAAALASTLRLLGVTVVLHMHNPLPSGLDPAQVDELKGMPIIFCSRFLENAAKSKHSGALLKTTHLYNGADGKLFFPRLEAETEAAPTVLFVGRLIPFKGAHVLLKAMSMLGARGVNTFCKIVGASYFGGSKPNQYMKTLERSCPDNAKLEGYRSGSQLAEEFRLASIFCCPSTWEEPFGMVIVEAMASGVPVVASQVGGIPEVLEFGGGLMVPEALASALQSLIANSKLRTELGRQGLAAFKDHFSWIKIQLRYQDILKEIVV
jgi:spore coat protein SA